MGRIMRVPFAGPCSYINRWRRVRFPVERFMSSYVGRRTLVSMGNGSFEWGWSTSAKRLRPEEHGGLETHVRPRELLDWLPWFGRDGRADGSIADARWFLGNGCAASSSRCDRPARS